MAGRMIRCTGEHAGERCHRHNRVVAPQGVSTEGQAYKCDGCSTGQKPFVPRDSARKGQQKQTAKKK